MVKSIWFQFVSVPTTPVSSLMTSLAEWCARNMSNPPSTNSRRNSTKIYSLFSQLNPSEQFYTDCGLDLVISFFVPNDPNFARTKQYTIKRVLSDKTLDLNRIGLVFSEIHIYVFPRSSRRIQSFLPLITRTSFCQAQAILFGSGLDSMWLHKCESPSRLGTNEAGWILNEEIISDGFHSQNCNV
jgi:hypothetical protein